jgi:hypothetical protein
VLAEQSRYEAAARVLRRALYLAHTVLSIDERRECVACVETTCMTCVQRVRACAYACTVPAYYQLLTLYGRVLVQSGRVALGDRYIKKVALTSSCARVVCCVTTHPTQGLVLQGDAFESGQHAEQSYVIAEVRDNITNRVLYAHTRILYRRSHLSARSLSHDLTPRCDRTALCVNVH